jgi:hypothetical protein
MKPKVESAKVMASESVVSSNPTMHDWDDMLLTPDNIKNILISSPAKSVTPLHPSVQEFILNHSSPSKEIPTTPSFSKSKEFAKENVAEQSKPSPINLLDLLAQKTSQNPVDSTPVKESTIPKPTPLASLPSTPNGTKKNPTSPTKQTPSSERWAGAAFFNSPAPTALPIPSFASPLSPAEMQTSPATKRLMFSPKKSENSSTTNGAALQQFPTKQPRPNSNVKKNSARPASPPKKLYVPKSGSETKSEAPEPTQIPVPVPAVASFPPMHSAPSLDQISSHLKMMLNICNV